MLKKPFQKLMRFKQDQIVDSGLQLATRSIIQSSVWQFIYGTNHQVNRNKISLISSAKFIHNEVCSKLDLMVVSKNVNKQHQYTIKRVKRALEINQIRYDTAKQT